MVVRQRAQQFTAAQFIGLSIAAGSGFFFMTLALEGMSFVQIVWARTLLGAVGLLAVVALTRGLAFPRKPAMWGHIAVLSVTNLLLPYVLLAWSQERIPSSLGAVYNAATPIFAAIMAVALFRVERLRILPGLGLLVGLGGVLMIIAPWESSVDTIDPLGTITCLAATACFGFSFAYIRRFVRHDELPGPALAVHVACAAAVCALAATPWMDLGSIRPDFSVVAAIIVLGIFGSGLAVMWSLNVIQRWGPSRASASLYVAPAIGVALGVTILGEAVRVNEVVGGAVVLLAIPLLNMPSPVPTPDGTSIPQSGPTADSSKRSSGVP